MGIELDVLVGHPEHELLFVAYQTAQAAGLKAPASSVAKARHRLGYGQQFQEMDTSSISRDYIPHRLRKDSVMFTEAEVYQMLLRGHAPASEPFRKWVTEEVLPSIRKTGKYNAEDSQNPIALAIMDELKSLRGEIVSLRQELQAKTFSLEAPKATEASPYEGQQKEYFFTPIGVVEPYCYIAKPDFGQGDFASERGKYKVNLTVPSDKAKPLIDKIVALYESDYAKRLTEHKKNPPQVARGKKPLTPYQGDLPFVENDDGTVTFKLSSYDRYERDGEVIMKPLKVVDSKGKAIPKVPNISGGSEGKARFSMMAYGWNPISGASVRLKLEGFMLTKLAEFAGSEDDWAGQEENETQAWRQPPKGR